MKGTVVSSWVDSSRTLFGNKVVDDALKAYGISSTYIFSPLEDIEDDKALGIVEYIGNAVGKNKEEIWFIMGEENVKTFSKLYPGFFRHDSAYQFLKAMNDVHVIVMKRFRGAKPPILDVTPISSKEIYFTYRSKRGMGNYLKGLISGVSHHFNEKIEVEEVSRTNDELILKLKFESEIQYVKRYFLNNLFSFGMIKSVTIKTAIMNLILVGLSGFALFQSPIKGLLAGVIAFVSSIITTSVLDRPRKLIFKELEKLGNRNFIESTIIKSNDEYEVYMLEID
ncbi:heme NO-binding domain-containing protein, partial [Anaerosporobacter sp.]